MELISAYRLNTVPIKMHDIHPGTLDFLRSIEWYDDQRNPKGFVILNKRFKLNEQHYRTMLRFKEEQTTHGSLAYSLDTPVPFLVVETEPSDPIHTPNGIQVRYKDTRVIHGRTVKTTIGYLYEGIPADLIHAVIEDLKDTAVYHDDIARDKSNKSNVIMSIDGGVVAEVQSFTMTNRRPIMMMGASAHTVITDDLAFDDDEEE